ncbi:helix-turn-helix domain-containing protein [Noviherbaspirillum sp. ST9]|uniref:helix-turn-helix domain-containing protein n=1 Tax=Noviherbaspirillum sp. ST9 TaxID=3401606 RepID=UPI003B589D8C
MLERFSKAIAQLYRLARSAEPNAFRQELLDLAHGLVESDGAVLHAWYLTTAAGRHDAPAHVVQRVITTLQEGIDAQGQSLSSSYFSSLAAPALLNSADAVMQHPLPMVRALHANADVRKLMLHGDCDANESTARWMILFRCGDRDFTSSDAAVLQAYWRQAIPALEINMQYALWRNDPQGADRAIALVNSLGIIEISDERMNDLLHQEWPLLRGSTLPRAALASLLATGSYHGKYIELQASQKMGYLVCHAQKARAVTVLTPSEISAVQCFARGMTHSAIAFHFGVSPHTVRNQLANAYRKLGVHSKAELIRVIGNI